MTYPYFQQNYPQNYQQTYLQNYPQTQMTSNDINWCQGESGAKSFPVSPGHTVPIFDSEDSCLYIKTVDVMGRPLPLKIFDYKERGTEVIEEKNYVEKTELEDAMISLNEKIDDVLMLLSKPEKKETKEKKDAK
jgi:hypothetical protein